MAQSLLTSVFLLFINLANGAFTARHLGSAGRGEQAAIGMWLPIITALCLLGMPNALRYQGRQHEEDRKELYGASLLIGSGSGALATLVGFFLLPFLLQRYGPSVIQDARIVMCFATISTLSLIFGGMLEARLNFRYANFTKWGPPSITLVSLITLASLHRLNPFTAVLSYVGPSGAISLVTGAYLQRTIGPTLANFKESATRLVSYGIRVTGFDLLGTFSQQIDQLLVFGLLNASDLGRYVIALQASRVLTVFQVALNSVLMPKVAGLPKREILNIVERASRLTIATTACMSAALIVTLPFLLPAVYGHAFDSSVPVSQLLAIEAVMLAGATTHAQAFMATNRPGTATLFQLGGLTIAAPLMLVLIPRFGLLGAAMSLTASTALRLTLAILSYPILLREPIPRLILTRDDISYLAQKIRR